MIEVADRPHQVNVGSIGSAEGRLTRALALRQQPCQKHGLPIVAVRFIRGIEQAVCRRCDPSAGAPRVTDAAKVLRRINAKLARA